MGISQRIQAFSVTHPFSINKKIDQYLSERLPDLMDEHKIADRSDLVDMEKDFKGLEQRMEELDSWKKGFSQRMSDGRSRLDRLKMKYGVE